MGVSARNTSLAVVAAVCFHVFLLTQTLSFRELKFQQEEPLKVIIVEEKKSPQPDPIVKPAPKPKPILESRDVEVEPAPVPLPDPTEQEPNLPDVDEFLVVTEEENEPTSRVVIQTSEQSRSFRRWLETETNSFAIKNPGSIGSFDQTFEAPKPIEESSDFTRDNKENIPTRDSRGTGEFIIEENGKRTCGLKVDSLLSSDSQGANGSAYVYADCTPEKKFDLKLGQPNNGWTDR